MNIDPKSETQKPDFDGIAESAVYNVWNEENDPKGDKTRNFIEDYSLGMEKCWDDYVIPLQSENQRLTEEARVREEYIGELREAIYYPDKSLKPEVERLTKINEELVKALEECLLSNTTLGGLHNDVVLQAKSAIEKSKPLNHEQS